VDIHKGKDGVQRYGFNPLHETDAGLVLRLVCRCMLLYSLHTFRLALSRPSVGVVQWSGLTSKRLSTCEQEPTGGFESSPQSPYGATPPSPYGAPAGNPYGGGFDNSGGGELSTSPVRPHFSSTPSAFALPSCPPTLDLLQLHRRTTPTCVSLTEAATRTQPTHTVVGTISLAVPTATLTAAAAVVVATLLVASR